MFIRQSRMSKNMRILYVKAHFTAVIMVGERRICLVRMYSYQTREHVLDKCAEHQPNVLQWRAAFVFDLITFPLHRFMSIII